MHPEPTQAWTPRQTACAVLLLIVICALLLFLIVTPKAADSDPLLDQAWITKAGKHTVPIVIPPIPGKALPNDIAFSWEVVWEKPICWRYWDTHLTQRGREIPLLLEVSDTDQRYSYKVHTPEGLRVTGPARFSVIITCTERP